MAVVRAIHVLSVVLWIGGVGFVTTVLLPGIRRTIPVTDRFLTFRNFESRFAWQARALVLIAGASGLYMLFGLHLQPALTQPGYWWLHAMIGLWFIFAMMLFVAEPFFLHRLMERRSAAAPEKFFQRVQIMHWVLFLLALVTVCGAVEGSHGGF